MSASDSFQSELCDSELPPPLSLAVELPPRRENSLLAVLEPVLSQVEEVQPVVDPDAFFASYGADFLHWCRERETPVTLVLPLSSLSRERARTLAASHLNRLAIVLDKIPVRGKRERDFWAGVEGVIGEIKSSPVREGGGISSLRLQVEGTGTNLLQMPGILEAAARMGMDVVVVTPAGAWDPQSAKEALERAAELGIDLDAGRGEAVRVSLLKERPSGRDEKPFFSGRVPGGWKHWLKKRLYREVLPDSVVTLSQLRPSGEKRKNCLFPWNWSYVSRGGEIRVCPVSGRAMGDLQKQSFPEVWNGPDYRNFRRRLLSPYPLAECRQCVFRGWFVPGEMVDWLWIGFNDQFGVQLGTGWHEVEGHLPFRWSRKEAVLRLKNSGKNTLGLVFYLPGRKVASSGEVWVEDRRAGSFRLKKPGDLISYFPVPPSGGEEILVRLVCSRELVPHRLLGNDDFRRLGVALKGAFLARR